MNFSHAMVIMWGAMVSYYLIAILRWPYLAALLAAIIVNILVNIAIYKICVERIGNLLTNTNWIISLFGIAHILRNLARMLFGAETYFFPDMFDGARLTIGDYNVLWHEILMFVLAILIGLSYHVMSIKTRFGRSLRAVAYRPDTALLMGIDSKKVIMTCFAMAGAVAALAGVLIAPITFASFEMTASVGIKGFAAAVIGGVGNTKGALIGGFGLGIAESILGIFVSAALRDAFSFLIMVVFIIFLPGGVMSARFFSEGRSTTEKV